MFGRLWQKLLRLWALAKAERASPREIGIAVFLGAFAGCTPAVGIHGPLGIGLATLFKKNRLWAWIGSRISNMLFLPFIALAEIQLSHVVRTGELVEIERATVMERAPELLLDWCLGTIPVGIVLGTLCGLLAYAWARRRPEPPVPPPDVTPPGPSSDPPRSSGSPA